MRDKEPKKNRKNKPRKPLRKPLSFGFIFSVFRILSLVGFVLAVSAGFVFCHDVILQLSFLKIKNIEVNGISRIPKSDILEKTGLTVNQNIMTFNNSSARKIIEAEPWIESAEVTRKLPDTVLIDVKEREAIALIYLGEFYVVDSKGNVFKKYEEGDPEDMPVITGLSYQDTIEDNSPGHQMWLSVFEILSKKYDVMPVKLIRSVSVDYQMGLNITLKDGPLIKLGTDNYNQKYERLSRLMHQNNRIIDYSEIETIDLQNKDRIIVGFKKEKTVEAETTEGKEA